MPIRNTTHILKNSDIVNRPLPSSLLKGEAIVNTADGILYFSGVTTSTSGWTQSSPSKPTFWEVGSNLYDLKIRNQIKSYSGVTNLSGFFLSGTSSGFVLAPISSIVGVDTYTTGFTYSNNVATIKQNIGQPDLSILINTMTGLTVNGNLAVNGNTTSNTLSATTITGGTIYGNGANITGLPYVTGGTPNNSAKTFTFTNSIGGTFTVNGLTDISVTGGTYSAGTTTFTNNTGGTFTVTGLNSTDTYATGFTYANNVFSIKQNQGQPDLTALINTVTGLTVNGTLSTTIANINTVNATAGTITTLASTTANINTISSTSITGTNITATNVYINGGIQSYSGNTNLSGQFLSGTTNGFVLGAISAITGVDTHTTGFTYTPSTNTLTIKRNLGQPDLTTAISTVSGLTVSNLGNNQIVYSVGGLLTTNSLATFNGTNMVLPSTGSLSVGTGGLVVGSGGSAGTAGTGDLVVNGNLTVFGGSVSAFTSQLYVEDPNVIFNYNPTGSTIATSIGAGLTIQDGNGVVNGSVALEIRPMNTFTGLTASQVPSITEYTGADGYTNRAWVTQLNDIVVRSTSTSTPNGVRVLAEFDILDGGTY